MDIKKFIQDPRVSNLSGNEFKFLLELFSMSNENGVINNFTIMEFAKKAKEENNGHCTSRNSLAKYMIKFQNIGVLTYNRYSKIVEFKV